MSTGESVLRPEDVGAGRARHLLQRALHLLHRYSFGFAGLLTLVLLMINLQRTSSFGWTQQLANFAPLALAAIASTPSIISGGGGFDLSISPLMIMTTAIFIVWLVPAGLGGAVSVPILLAVGAAVGGLNGLLIILLRIPPVVVTLSMYFILIGVNLKIVASPESVEGTWMQRFSGTIAHVPGALFLIGFPILIWFLLNLTPYLRTLYAVGSNDATAYSSGVNIALVRVIAYALGGMFAAVGGIAIIAISSSASASLSTTYALQAIAAVALGGTSLWGGRGGLIGSVLGAACIYLLGTLLITLQVTPSWLQVMYGCMLLVAVVLVSVAARTSST
jgi:ribose transport system permease protein